MAEVLPRELNEKRAALAQLERARMEPQKTKEDVVRGRPAIIAAHGLLIDERGSVCTCGC